MQKWHPCHKSPGTQGHLRLCQRTGPQDPEWYFIQIFCCMLIFKTALTPLDVCVSVCVGHDRIVCTHTPWALQCNQAMFRSSDQRQQDKGFRREGKAIRLYFIVLNIMKFKCWSWPKLSSGSVGRSCLAGLAKGFTQKKLWLHINTPRLWCFAAVLIERILNVIFVSLKLWQLRP